MACGCRQGCYAPDDIAVLTPYLGQLLLLRKALERHTVVHLEEADAKLLQDLEEADAGSNGMPSGSDTAAGDGAQPGEARGGNARLAEANASIKTSSLRSMLRLATVDNFQGGCASVICCWQMWPLFLLAGCCADVRHAELCHQPKLVPAFRSRSAGSSCHSAAATVCPCNRFGVLLMFTRHVRTTSYHYRATVRLD